MISFAEFEIALRGLMRLVRFDAGFAGFFDLSREGARRSFRLALPILPFYLVLQFLNAEWPAGADMTRAVLVDLIGYVLMWVAFPLTLLLGARLIDRGPRVFGAITLYNWLSVVSVGLAVPINVAQYLGLDPSAAALLQHIVLFFVIACEWFAFRRLLEISFEMTLALVAIDFIEGEIVLYAMDWLSRMPPLG